MPNPHSAWRIDVARQLAERLTPLKGLRAIVVAGSVARNYADEYSDVEIPIFWENLPNDNTRHSIAQSLEAEFLFAYDGPANEDQLLLGGLQVDLWHIAVSHQEEVIKGVLSVERTDLGSLNAMDTIRCCIPLYGKELVGQWKARATEYPETLAASIIEAHLPSFRLDQLVVSADRNDLPGFYSELTFLQREVFLVLLALNRRYFPTFKWLNQTLEALPQKPDSITSRFRGAFSNPLSTAISDMQSMIVDTAELVQEGFPGLDTGPALHRLRHRRRPVRAPSS
jgi:predicted nucleotidyltransferase